MTRRTRRALATVSLASTLLAACVSASAGGARRPSDDRATRWSVARAPVEATEGHAPRRSIEPGTGTAERDLAIETAPWAAELETLIDARPVSVSVAVGGRMRFSHLGRVPRIPASNQKLLLSMALLDRFGPRARIPTTVELVRDVRDGVVRGDAWLVGHGDPEVGDGDIARLAALVAGEGITRITGSVVGDTSSFRRERWAPGWHRIALSYVSIPTALTFDANVDASGFVFHPERDAATALTVDLRALGVSVAGPPRARPVPEAARPIARIRSAPIVQILRRQNASSINLDAEVLGKRLGAIASGRRGSTARGARAIAAWAARHGVHVVAHDASGLSYANRVTTDGLVRLLVLAGRASWGAALRSTLPVAGRGTLSGRLGGIDVRAKTGTLIDGVSALSGWVRTASRRWAAFSILSERMSKDDAVAVEDAVVRFVAERI